ncbi:hypothetical protein Tco_0481679 [Tanacetum coccineum]
MILSPSSSAKSASISCWFRWFQFVGLFGLAAPTIAAEFSALALRRMIRAGNMAVRCTGYLLTEKISGVLFLILPHPLKTHVSFLRVRECDTASSPQDTFDPFLDIYSDEIKFQVMVVRAIEVFEDSDLNLGMSCASQGSRRSLGSACRYEKKNKAGTYSLTKSIESTSLFQRHSNHSRALDNSWASTSSCSGYRSFTAEGALKCTRVLVDSTLAAGRAVSCLSDLAAKTAQRNGVPGRLQLGKPNTMPTFSLLAGENQAEEN